ncbi:MAG: hypothetical protein EYC69_11735 [Bacteroidetes bacterium]|nr:MAG: hypothetical protein EYC69_11735 [Bacteroidota bacterium]
MRKSHGSTFVIDHVDAHADLGMCDFRVVNMFVDSERLKGSDWITDEKEAELDLNPGNFLLFFLSQHWLEELYYITNINYPHIDIPPNLISKTDSGIERLEMKYFENIDDISNPKLGTYIPGISSIPFQKIDYKTFNNCHQYDYMFLTQSPDYSPSESDALIDVIMQFIEITDPS